MELNAYTKGLERAVGRIEDLRILDAPASVLEPIVDRLTQSNTVKRWLSGAPIGHRVHPLLTDIPIGSWTSASVLDLVAWRSGESAARRLTALGVISAVPTAITGLSDWRDTTGGTKRIGVVHLAGNVATTLLELASWRARSKGHHLRGALLGLAGLSTGTVAGYLGGHLVFAQRAGVDVDVAKFEREGWYEAARVDELVDDAPIGVDVEGARIALVKTRGQVFALAATCTHAGGPLDKGEVANGAITCPWHGSQFCLDDGRVERGPAATPAPVYETRQRGDVIEVRRLALDETPTRAPGNTDAPSRSSEHWRRAAVTPT